VKLIEEKLHTTQYISYGLASLHLENTADFPKPAFIRKGLWPNMPQLIYQTLGAIKTIMNNLLIKLIGKKINLNGQIGYGRPEIKWRQKMYDNLVASSFIKTHRNVQSFDLEKLKEVINDLIKHYQDKNHAFVANVYSSQRDGVQIVHPFMNHDKITNRSKDFGFSVYFTFDHSFDDSIEQHQLFKGYKFDNLDYFVHDELVHCYDINCGMDKEKVFAVIDTFYHEILSYERKTQFYFDASSHGEIK
jgi:hypothetical protein